MAGRWTSRSRTHTIGFDDFDDPRARRAARTPRWSPAPSAPTTWRREVRPDLAERAAAHRLAPRRAVRRPLGGAHLVRLARDPPAGDRGALGRRRRRAVRRLCRAATACTSLEDRLRPWIPAPLRRGVFPALGRHWPRSPRLPRPLRLGGLWQNLARRLRPRLPARSTPCCRPTSGRRLGGQASGAGASTPSPPWRRTSRAPRRSRWRAPSTSTSRPGWPTAAWSRSTA